LRDCNTGIDTSLRRFCGGIDTEIEAIALRKFSAGTSNVQSIGLWRTLPLAEEDIYRIVTACTSLAERSAILWRRLNFGTNTLCDGRAAGLSSHCTENTLELNKIV
jgi:hypothetical protein